MEGRCPIALMPAVRIFGLLALLGLGACAGRPDPALRLVEGAAPGATAITLLAATTRRPTDDEALRFGGERSLSPRYAAMTVSIPPNHRVGEITWPPGGRADPARHFAVTRFDSVPREQARAALRETMRRNRHHHVLLFVHGYNTRFDEAAFRLAQIVHDSGAPVTPVLFSWPSWGTLAAYPYDRESAATARDGLEATIAAITSEPAVEQLTVLAHSMGGWLTLEAMRQMAIRNKALPRKFTDLVLAAPDVDVDVALAQGRAIQAVRQRPRVTLLVSEDDRALGASRLLWGSRDRLGAIDPDKEPYRTNLARAGVEVVDLTAVRSGDPLNHGKFAESPAVVRRIGERLAGGQRLHGETSLGEGIGAFTQGTIRIVGDVVTAPLRLGEGPAPGGGSPAPAE